MLTSYRYRNLRWVDLESPTRSEVKQVIHEYGVHPKTAEELLLPTLHPKTEVIGTALFTVLHFPAIKHTHARERSQEVDFIISKNFLITTHYDTVDSIHKFAKEFEVNALIDKSAVTKHAGYIFSNLVKKLYRSLGHELEYIRRSLEDIEEKIFKEKEKEMVRSISEMTKNLLNIKRTIHDHADVLLSLEESGKKLFGPTFLVELRSIGRQYKAVTKTIENELEFLDELRNTNDSLLSTKQNEIMKVLTIMAFVTFPLSLIAAIVSMETTTRPLTGYVGDFWVVILLMLVLTGGFFAFFKYKKWL